MCAQQLAVHSKSVNCRGAAVLHADVAELPTATWGPCCTGGLVQTSAGFGHGLFFLRVALDLGV